MADFDNATFYDCDDSEVLEHRTVEDAIRAHLERRTEDMIDTDDDGEWMREAISLCAPVTVTASVNVTVREHLWSSLLDAWQDCIADDWCEEYGNDDDGVGIPELSPKDREELESVLDRAWKRGKPWFTERVGKRTYSEAELLALFFPEEVPRD